MDGFDIAHAFDAHAFAREPGWACLAGGPRVGLLIGNTRALWPVFSAARRDEPDPLDRFTERTLTARYPNAPIFYAHRRYRNDAALASSNTSAADNAFLPFTRLAVATGLGALSPGNLILHPVFGPWLALRAVVLVDGDPPPRAPIAKPCACDGTCERALAAALPTTDWRAWLAVRDACSLRTYRYGEDQLRFHYATAWERFPPSG